MALAAYNVGMGHLEDARKITESLGGNPDHWAEVREQLPKLAKRQYYKYTKHGYARGWEPVTYVRNIRNYYNIIAWNYQQEQRQMARQEPHPIQQVESKVSLRMPLSVL